MAIPTLAEVKAHLRVQYDFENDLIAGYLDAAVESAEAFTRRKYTGDDAEPMTPAARQAVLLLVGHFYENRQSVITGTIATALPMAVEHLLWPLRKRVYPLRSGA